MPYKSKTDQKEYSRKWLQDNYDRIQNQKRRWRMNNPEKANLAAFKRHLRNTYKLTYEEYQMMDSSQQSLCAICGNPDPGGRRLSVDHDHDTGKVRALLCNLCNTGLGSFRDDTLRLYKAIEYLEYYKNVSL